MYTKNRERKKKREGHLLRPRKKKYRHPMTEVNKNEVSNAFSGLVSVQGKKVCQRSSFGAKNVELTYFRRKRTE
jgi:hypothetical protein